MDLTLTRDAKADEGARLGVLALTAAQGLQTLEPDAADVPAGTYQLALHDTPAHPHTFALVNPELGVYHEPGDIPEGETGRDAVLIHTGNVEEDSKGCILLGMARGELESEPAVLLSGRAFALFKATVPWVKGHTLTITESAAPE